MDARTTDRRFAGAIPALYDGLLVPLIFEPYAADLAARVAAVRPARVLEIAAGTGALTRSLSERLGHGVALTATDLNPPMLAHAQTRGTAHPVHWQTADAQALPFDDRVFDAVACQFGAMFFADKACAFAEMRRVLRPGGTLLFNVWDRLEANDFALAVTEAMARRYPGDPPRFLARTPHGHGDPDAIARDLRAGGFAEPPRLEIRGARSRAPTARVAAEAYCLGTPLRDEIEARDPGGLAGATDAAEAELAARFSPGPVDGRIQALVVQATA